MKKDLEAILYIKFSYMFVKKDLGPEKSNMCFGFECGDGWFSLLEDLCNKIDLYLKDKPNMKKEFMVNQVKEKFGTLRFYVTIYDDQIERYIEEAEARSAETCEVCGKPGKVIKIDGWLSCLCKMCI